MKRGGLFGFFAAMAAAVMAAGAADTNREQQVRGLHDYFLRLPRCYRRPHVKGNRAQRHRQLSGFRAMGTA